MAPKNVNTGYEPLGVVLDQAYQQAASGKGRSRHAASGKPFINQPIMEIGRMVGPGYATGQAMKKLQEAKSMMDRGDFAAAKAEALGAINYCAAFFMLVCEEEHSAQAPANSLVSAVEESLMEKTATNAKG